jgi:hypothetical protein
MSTERAETEDRWVRAAALTRMNYETTCEVAGLGTTKALRAGSSDE